MACMCVCEGNFIKWARFYNSSLFIYNQIFDKFWSIILTNSYDIQLSLATSIIYRLSHLNTHTTTDNNFQDISQRFASSSTHPCSEPRNMNENAIFKQTSLLTPLSNVNFRGHPWKSFIPVLACLTIVQRRRIKLLQNNLSQIRA